MKRGVKALRNRCWNYFSLYIRYRDRGRCISCGIKKEPQLMHAGHFKHNGLDFDERNINCQCPKCNTFLHGNLYAYGKALERLYGEDIDAVLTKAKSQEKKYTYQELEEKERQYKKIAEDEKVKYMRTI